MSYGSVPRHRWMALDTVRNDAYAAALRQVVGPETVVLDLGAGTGVHGLMAARMGARRVIELTLDQNILQIGRFRLAGEGTQLQLDGRLGLKDQTIDVQATGDANLGILQGFFRDLRTRGTADLKAQLAGTFTKPVFSGSATLNDGRLRHFSLPHSLESINGRLSFDASGIRVDEVTGRLGSGNVTFGGRIGLNGFALGDLSLTATGERMTVRYPEGFRSIIDADLGLQGTMNALVLNGTVVVQDGVWSKRIETSPISSTSRVRRRPRSVRARRRRRRRCDSTSPSSRRPPCASRTTSPTWWRAPI